MSGPSGAETTCVAPAPVCCEQAVERERELRRSRRPVVAPRRRQRRGERGLLVEQLLGAVAHAARLAQQHERVVGKEVGEQALATAVSHGSHDSMPSNVWPSARRSHDSAPHGCARDQRAARARTSAVGSSSRAGKI